MSDNNTPSTSDCSPWELARDAAIAGYQAAEDALLEGARPGYASPMLDHIGSAHLPIDVIAHQAVERFVYGRHKNHVQVIGEEVRRSIWTPVGGLVVTVDPVDGTGPATDLGFGWSTVVMVHQLRRISQQGKSDWKLVGAAIVDSSGHVSALVRKGVVHTSDISGLARRTSHIDPTRPATAVAAVGAKSTARSGWSQLAESSTGACYNLGGTPTCWGLLRGNLAATAVLEASTQWDALHVLLASQAGAVVVRLDDFGYVPTGDVLQWFDSPAFEGDGPARPVPPCVVAADLDTALSVAHSARGALAAADRR